MNIEKEEISSIPIIYPSIDADTNIDSLVLNRRTHIVSSINDVNDQQIICSVNSLKKVNIHLQKIEEEAKKFNTFKIPILNITSGISITFFIENCYGTIKN